MNTTKLSDIKKYRGYIPVRMEKEDSVRWLAKVVGKEWEDTLWYDKRCRMHFVRYRYGDVNEIQFYRKDKTWIGMPIDCWMKVIHLDISMLDDACWQWIRERRRECGVKDASRKTVATKSKKRDAMSRVGL